MDSAGDVIHYTVTLNNTGSVALTGVTVSDPLVTNLVRVSGDTDGDNQLDTTETWIYTGTYTVLQSDIDNNGGGDGDIDNTVTGDTTQTTPPDGQRRCENRTSGANDREDRDTGDLHSGRERDQLQLPGDEQRGCDVAGPIHHYG